MTPQTLIQTNYFQEFGFLIYFIFYPSKGKWANPEGTAIPGQPVARAEQAPDISPQSKNQFNIEVPLWRTYQILS